MIDAEIPSGEVLGEGEQPEEQGDGGAEAAGLTACRRRIGGNQKDQRDAAKQRASEKRCPECGRPFTPEQIANPTPSRRTRLARASFTALATASAMLLVLFAVQTHLTRHGRDILCHFDGGWTWFGVTFDKGHLVVVGGRNPGSDPRFSHFPPPWVDDLFTRNTWSPNPWRVTATHTAVYRAAGFGYVLEQWPVQRSMFVDDEEITLDDQAVLLALLAPCWFALALLAVLPAAWTWGAFRRRRLSVTP